MSIGRHEGFTRLEQIAKHIKNADRHKFYCVGCKRDLTGLVYGVPHDGEYHSVRCPRCKKLLRINSVRASATMLFNTIRYRKWSPSVGSGLILPDAPKLIKREVAEKKKKPKPKKKAKKQCRLLTTG